MTTTTTTSTTSGEENRSLSLNESKPPSLVLVRGGVKSPRSSSNVKSKKNQAIQEKRPKETTSLCYFEILQDTKRIENLFEYFQPFEFFDRGGLQVNLAHTTARKLLDGAVGGRFPLKREIRVSTMLYDMFTLTRDNMKALYDTTEYGETAGWDDQTKWDELTAPTASYIVVYKRRRRANDVVVSFDNDPTCGAAPQGRSVEEKRFTGFEELAGFLHFRFETDDDNPNVKKRGMPVAYLWDLQLKGWAQRQGLGKHLLNIIELTCTHWGVPKIMCTVLKENHGAMRFYRHKCNFVLDESSPDQFAELDDDCLCEYDILKKEVHTKKRLLPPPLAI